MSCGCENDNFLLTCLHVSVSNFWSQCTRRPLAVAVCSSWLTASKSEIQACVTHSLALYLAHDRSHGSMPHLSILSLGAQHIITCLLHIRDPADCMLRHAFITSAMGRYCDRACLFVCLSVCLSPLSVRPAPLLLMFSSLLCVESGDELARRSGPWDAIPLRRHYGCCYYKQTHCNESTIDIMNINIHVYGINQIAY